MCFRNCIVWIWGSFLRCFRNWVLKLAGYLPRASPNTKGLSPTESLLMLHNHHPPLLFTICPACQLIRHMTNWNSVFLLDANCQRLGVSHRKIGCGSTRKISRVEVVPMHPFPEPSLLVLVVPGMKDHRTSEVLLVLICPRTRS